MSEQPSAIAALRESLPDWAKDLKLNLSAVLRATELDDVQKYGALLACAVAARNERLLEAVKVDARARLGAQEFDAALVAAAVMGTNNVYYRFVHLVSNEEYARLPAGLRMQGLANHGARPVDFELWALAVSAVNGCGLCLDSHERKLRTEGASPAQVQAAVRIAAVVAGLAAVLEAAPAFSAA